MLSVRFALVGVIAVSLAANAETHVDWGRQTLTCGTVNPANEYGAIGGVPVQYDAAGNLCHDEDGRGYEYDEQNRLTRVFVDTNSNCVFDGGETQLAACTCDAFGRKVTATIGAVTTRFYYDGQRVIEERNAGDAVVRYHVNGAQFIDEHIATYDAATAAWTYYLPNANYSVAGTGDASGTTIERLDYSASGDFASGPAGTYAHDADGDADIDLLDFANLQVCFGTTVPACLDVHDFDLDGQSDGVINIDDFDGFAQCFNGPDFAPQPGCEVAPPKFRGTPPETGMFTLHGRPIDVLPDGKVLMDFRTRIYDPQHGRWLQRDPIGYADGPSLYEAFKSNAASNVDPRGLDSIEDEGNDLVYKADGFQWTFAQGLGTAYVLIDHPDWPYAFIMSRDAARGEFNRPWYGADFTHPYEIMQHATALVTRSGAKNQFLAVLDKRGRGWLVPDEILFGDRQLEFQELAKHGLARMVGELKSLTAVSYSVVTGSLAAPAGAGAATVDVAASTLDLASGDVSTGQVVALSAVVGGALLHLHFADDARAIGAAGRLEPRIRVGPGGRVESAFARIQPEHLFGGTRTTAEARALARQLGEASDDAGHVIGRALGGPGGATSGNIIPQAANINRGAFREFEQMIAARVAAGDEVFVRIAPRYRGIEARPYEILYQARINGETISRVFPNP